MQVTATEAKNRFGYFCAKAKDEPVFIEKDGRLDSVIMSFDGFQALQQAKAPVSFEDRKRAFDEKYKDWISAQNAHHDSHGLWCEGLVAWPGDV
ncbi:MAG: prevent-host-death protein [Rhodoferax sp.]|uniref:prevent-host-death protein n=1 Tax=Rhodoferax sp. TaxID=50421 RepID=UPI00262BA260|nr:prevent-host-death protein [Rhodoferax sp.]MDD2880383.1 prevent-host-death protein [Rhodoferax sp.]